jgi:hypothetical protein
MSTDLPADDASSDRSDVRPRQLGEGPMSARPDALSLAITSGAITALRKRAKAIRDRAVKTGVSIIDSPFVVIRTSESAHALKIAADLDRIADDLERRSAP